MATYLAWSPDLGDEEDEATTLNHSFSMEDAAEDAAKLWFDERDGGEWANYGISVRVSDGTSTREFHVSVDYEPRFYADDRGEVVPQEMPETFWITKYVGTVREATCRVSRWSDGTERATPAGDYSSLAVGHDCFRSEAKAMADAERRKAKKVASLRRQIEKLETTPIKVVRLSPDSPADGEDA